MTRDDLYYVERLTKDLKKRPGCSTDTALMAVIKFDAANEHCKSLDQISNALETVAHHLTLIPTSEMGYVAASLDTIAEAIKNSSNNN